MNMTGSFFKVKKLILFKSSWAHYCKLSYPNHPKGCPMFNTRLTCPPQAPHVSKVLDMSQEMWIAYSLFDLKSHKEKMKQLHPQWTERQCQNVLYWQGTSRKQARQIAAALQAALSLDIAIECPEGMGVNVYATMAIHKVPLEKIKELQICRHVILLGKGLK